MHYYILSCFMFVIIAIAEYACVLIMQDSQDMAKTIHCKVGLAVFLAFLMYNLIFIFSM